MHHIMTLESAHLYTSEAHNMKATWKRCGRTEVQVAVEHDGVIGAQLSGIQRGSASDHAQINIVLEFDAFGIRLDISLTRFGVFGWFHHLPRIGPLARITELGSISGPSRPRWIDVKFGHCRTTATASFWSVKRH